MFTIVDINKIKQEACENEFDNSFITTDIYKVNNANEDKTKYRQKPEVVREILAKESKEIQYLHISENIVNNKAQEDVKSELHNDETDNNEADTTPSTSKMSSIKKRRHLDLGYLSVGEKQSIINTYKDFSSDVPNMPKMNTSAIVNKIANTAGIARSTVYRIIKEYKETGNVNESKHSGGRPNLINTYDDYTTKSVRRIINSYINKNEIPTVDKILNEIQNRPDLPQMSRSSLYRFMKKINFK